MDAIVTWLFGFLTGTITGAAGKYLADKYTDQRKEQEASAKLQSKYRNVQQQMPDLIAEIKSDLVSENGALVREFVILPNNHVIFTSSTPRFVYFEDQIPDLRNKVALLVDAQFVADVTPKSTPIFRMHESFVQFLQAQ